jgi:hypothetical protein
VGFNTPAEVKAYAASGNTTILLNHAIGMGKFVEQTATSEEEMTLGNFYL